MSCPNKALLDEALAKNAALETKVERLEVEIARLEAYADECLEVLQRHNAIRKALKSEVFAWRSKFPKAGFDGTEIADWSNLPSATLQS